jgi:hypothetical protein
MAKWSHEIVQQVWEKATRVHGYDEFKYRKDQCGAWMESNKLGDHKAQFGWDIVRIDPDGPDDLSNLMGLYWQNKAESEGTVVCNYIAEGAQNVKK